MKAEDDDMEYEEQLDKWIAEMNAAKILREECKVNLKRAQEKKDAADSKYEESTSRLLAALMKNRKRAH